MRSGAHAGCTHTTRSHRRSIINTMEPGTANPPASLPLCAPSDERDSQHPPEKTVQFDDILQDIGPFGWSQIRTFLLTSSFDILIAFQLMFFLFGGVNPGWYCIPSEVYAGGAENGSEWLLPAGAAAGAAGPGARAAGTELLVVNETRPAGLLAGSITRSYLVRPEWDGVCSVNGSTCSRIIFKPGITTIITEFSLVCDLKYVSTFCTTMAMVGILFGAAAGGYLSDLLGRRPVFFSIASGMLVVQFVQSLSPVWQMFAGMRFFAGFFSGAFMVVTYITPLEVVGRQWRTLCGCIGFWQVGQALFVGLGVAIPNWRYLSLATAALCTPLLLSWFFLSESPRWLIQKERTEEAHMILTRMAKLNRKPPPSKASLKRIVKQTTPSQKYTTLDLFRGKEYTKKTLVMFYLWFSCTMTYYGLSLNTRDISDKVAINVLIMTLTELVFVVTVIYSTYKFGRRPALVFYLSVTSCCLMTALVLKFTQQSVMAQSVLGSVGRASLSAGWGVAYLLAVELYPTVIRGVASGSCSVAGRIGGILAPQVAYLKFIHPVIPGVVYSSFAVVALLLVYFFLPETRGTNLPDRIVSKAGCCTSADNDSNEDTDMTQEELKKYDPTAV